jgi:hypothetical protein
MRLRHYDCELPNDTDCEMPNAQPLRMKRILVTWIGHAELRVGTRTRL